MFKVWYRGLCAQFLIDIFDITLSSHLLQPVEYSCARWKEWSGFIERQRQLVSVQPVNLPKTVIASLKGYFKQLYSLDNMVLLWKNTLMKVQASHHSSFNSSGSFACNFCLCLHPKKEPKWLFALIICSSFPQRFPQN